MNRDASFGQYYPVNSFLHSMDPRAKILLVTAYITCVFLARSFAGFGLVLLFLTAATACSRVPVRSILRSIRPIMFLIIFTAVFNLLFSRPGNIVLDLGFIRITDAAIYFTVAMAIRLTLLVAGTSLLTLTTTPVALTDGLESLLKPLNVVRFPVHEFALIMSIALRFIPTLTDETDRIIRAQKARGADFDTGSIFRRARALVPVLIPLLISSFRRAEELSDAMDSRCYSGAKGRTKYKKLRLGWRDFAGALVCAALIACVVTFQSLGWFTAII